MDRILALVAQGWSTLFGVIAGITVGDILDIVVLSFLLYKAIQLVRETHAGQLMKGVIYLLVAYLVASILDMNMMKMILEVVWEIGLIAIIVLFQPELRMVLEKLGKSKLGVLGRVMAMEEEEQLYRNTLDSVVKSCSAMAETKTGALIVLEQTTILNDVVHSGSEIDGAVSKDLLCNIFYPKSPLHDGAVIIRNNRLCAASCILPLTQNSEISRELGTRHRAAIGLSEQSDAVVVVVSEETGVISVVQRGQIRRGFDSITLKTELEAAWIGDRFEKKTDSKIKVFKRRSK